MFWIIVIIALIVAGGLMTTDDAYYVRQSDEAFGLVIGGIAIGAIIMRLFG